MKKKPAPKPHAAGIAAAGVSMLGGLITALPALAGHVPPNYGWAVLLGGIVLQGITKGIQHGGTDLVPKGD